MIRKSQMDVAQQSDLEREITTLLDRALLTAKKSLSARLSSKYQPTSEFPYFFIALRYGIYRISCDPLMDAMYMGESQMNLTTPQDFLTWARESEERLRDVHDHLTKYFRRISEYQSKPLPDALAFSIP